MQSVGTYKTSPLSLSRHLQSNEGRGLLPWLCWRLMHIHADNAENTGFEHIGQSYFDY